MHVELRGEKIKGGKAKGRSGLNNMEGKWTRKGENTYKKKRNR